MGEAMTRGLNSPFKTPGPTGKVRAALRQVEKANSQLPLAEGPPSRQVRRRAARKVTKIAEARLRAEIAAAFVKAIRASRKAISL